MDWPSCRNRLALLFLIALKLSNVVLGQTVNSRPDAPQNLSGIADNQAVHLSWTLNVEPDILYYNIYGDTTSSGTLHLYGRTSLPSDSSITINGLLNGRTYYLCITAVDSIFQESDFSNLAIVKPSQFILLSQPFKKNLDGALLSVDFDLDKDYDIVISGKDSSGAGRTYFIENEYPHFEQSVILDRGAHHGFIAVGDLDQDNDPDFLLAGEQAGTSFSGIYVNDKGQLLLSSLDLPGFRRGGSIWQDFNNDGRRDLLIIGMQDGHRSTILFENLGGILVEHNSRILALSDGDLAAADFDRDGDRDIVVMGLDDEGLEQIQLFENRQMDFGPVDLNLPGLSRGSIDCGDYNNDGFPDLLITGRNASGISAAVLRNDGDWLFSEINVDIDGVYDGQAKWGDLNNDGFLDIALTGRSANGPITKVYFQMNNGFRFAEELEGLHEGQISLVDLTGDHTLDIALSGNRFTYLFENRSVTANSRPATPFDVKSFDIGDTLVVSWHPSTDPESPQRALTYNVSLEAAQTNMYAISPLADTSTGSSYVVGLSNVGSDTTIKIVGLADGLYQARVQAIDQAFQNSAFSASGHISWGTAPAWSLPDTLSMLEDSTLRLNFDDFLTDGNNPDSTLHISFRGGEQVTLTMSSGSHIGIFRPDTDFFGVEEFEAVVTDNSGLRALKKFWINVVPVNDPPRFLSVLPDTTIVFPEVLSLAVASWQENVIDVDDRFEDLKWRLFADSSAQIYYSESSDSVYISIQGTASMQIPVTVEVRDTSHASAETAFTLETANINRGPVITAFDTLRLIEDKDTTIAFSNWFHFVSDPDDPSASLQWRVDSGINIESGLNSDSTEVTFVPSANWNGKDSLIIEVQDEGGLSDSTWLQLIVKPVNDLPEIESAHLSPAHFNVEYSQVLRISDIDGDSLSAELIENPFDWLNLDSGTKTLYGWPDIRESREDSIVVKIRDSDSTGIEVHILLSLQKYFIRQFELTESTASEIGVKWELNTEFDENEYIAVWDEQGNDTLYHNLSNREFQGGTIISGLQENTNYNLQLILDADDVSGKQLSDIKSIRTRVHSWATAYPESTRMLTKEYRLLATPYAIEKKRHRQLSYILNTDGYNPKTEKVFIINQDGNGLHRLEDDLPTHELNPGEAVFISVYEPRGVNSGSGRSLMDDDSLAVDIPSLSGASWRWAFLSNPFNREIIFDRFIDSTQLEQDHFFIFDSEANDWDLRRIDIVKPYEKILVKLNRGGRIKLRNVEQNPGGKREAETADFDWKIEVILSDEVAETQQVLVVGSSPTATDGRDFHDIISPIFRARNEQLFIANDNEDFLGDTLLADFRERNQPVYEFQIAGTNKQNSARSLRFIADGLPERWDFLAVDEQNNVFVEEAQLQDIRADFRLKLIVGEMSTISDIKMEYAAVNSELIVHHPYPNPFNQQVKIKYNLPNYHQMTLEVHDVLGRKVRTIFKNQSQIGEHIYDWDSKTDNQNIATSGVYFLVLSSSAFREVRRINLVK